MTIAESRKGNKYDIDTPEGAEKYLRDEGIDVDDFVTRALNMIKELRKKLIEKVIHENNIQNKQRDSDQDHQRKN